MAGIFGRRLKQKRGEAGLTRAELADRVALSISYLGRIERGTANLTLETMVSLADAVNGEVPELLKPDL